MSTSFVKVRVVEPYNYKKAVSFSQINIYNLVTDSSFEGWSASPTPCQPRPTSRWWRCGCSSASSCPSWRSSSRLTSRPGERRQRRRGRTRSSSSSRLSEPCFYTKNFTPDCIEFCESLSLLRETSYARFAYVDLFQLFFALLNVVGTDNIFPDI